MSVTPNAAGRTRRANVVSRSLVAFTPELRHSGVQSLLRRKAQLHRQAILLFTDGLEFFCQHIEQPGILVHVGFDQRVPPVDLRGGPAFSTSLQPC